MSNIYNTISDPMYQKQLIDSYENENMNQWLLYQWDWWNKYYDSKNSTYQWNDILSLKDFSNFINNLFVPKNKTVFISLWCGNSETEKYILKHLKQNKDVMYIGVDASDQMLELSIENLKDLNNEKVFLRADFWSDEFKHEIHSLSENFDERIFTFMWGTFWNIKYTRIINILNNILTKNDKIWIDIWIRKSINISEDLALFNIYKSYLVNSWKKDFLLNKIKNDGIDIEKWKLIIESQEFSDIKALQFSFFFKFHEKIEINVKNYKITFLPWYKLKLLQIYRFDPMKFIELFEWYHFKFIKNELKWYDGQFLFEKK